LSGLGVDGNILHGIFHTRKDHKAWWKVNLESDFLINEIVVYNRLDCCTERLDNFYVKILKDGKIVWEVLTAKATKVITFDVPGHMVGDQVMIQLKGTDYLHLIEVEVFGRRALDNVALKKPTSQSSNYNSATLSGLGVDGNILHGIFHTRKDHKAWWKVDLESDFLINEIVVYNRLDCCTERLDNFYVKILKDGKIVWEVLTAKATKVITFDVPGHMVGDQVMIQLKGTDYLHLIEVEVFGKRAANQKRCDDLYILEDFTLETTTQPVLNPPIGTSIIASYEYRGTYPIHSGEYIISNINYDSICTVVKSRGAPKCEVEVKIRFCKFIDCERTTMYGKFMASGTGPEPYVISGGTGDLFAAQGTIDSDLRLGDLALTSVTVNLCFKNRG